MPVFPSIARILAYTHRSSIAFGAAHRTARFAQSTAPCSLVLTDALTVRLRRAQDASHYIVTLTQRTNQRDVAEQCVRAVVWWLNREQEWSLVGGAVPLFVTAVEATAVADVDHVLESPWPVRCLSLSRSPCANVHRSQLTRFAALVELDVSETCLTDLSPFAHLRDLETLTCCDVDTLVDAGRDTSGVSAHRAFCALRTLNLQGCTNLCDVSIFCTATAVESLNLTDCAGVAHLDQVVSGMTGLRELRAAGTGLCDVRFLACCPALEVLDVAHCVDLCDLSALSAMSQLRELCLFQTGVTNLSCLAQVNGRLEVLNVAYCRGLMSLVGLEGARRLRYLSATSTGLRDVDPLRECVHLRHLDLHGCVEITQLEALLACGELRVLDADGCCALAHVDPLRGCPQLTFVRLSSCTALTSLAGLRGAVHLDVLHATHTAIDSLLSLSECTNLTAVHVSYCRSLKSLTGLQKATHLREVSAAATLIDNVDPLADCTTLEEVYVHECVHLLSIDGLQSSVPLTEVTLPDHLNHLKAQLLAPKLN